MMQRFTWLLLLLAPLSAQVLGEDAVPPDPAWRVARAQFATAIDNREPVDQVVVLTPPTEEVFFFTDIRNMEGRTITHRWEYEGQLVSRVPFEVKGPRWRVFSKFAIGPNQFGEWSVTVIDESGWPLYTELFRYEPTETEELPVPQRPNLSE